MATATARASPMSGSAQSWDCSSAITRRGSASASSALLGLIRTLRGLTPAFGCFTDAQFDEGRFEQHLEGNPGLAIAACYYWIRKLQARFFAEDYASAIGAAAKAERLLWTTPSHIEVPE